MFFRVIKENPERAYNTALERQAGKRPKKPDEQQGLSYCTRIGRSPRPPKRTKPIGWEPDSWETQ